MADLHCKRRRHARFDGKVIEIHCRWCSNEFGREVFHRWLLDTQSGSLLPMKDAHQSLSDEVVDGLRRLCEAA